MNMKWITLAASTLITLPLLGTARELEDPVVEIKAVLTDFHVAGSEADAERYLGYLADDGVFLGTDAAERWTRAEYVALVQPAMQRGVRIENRAVKQNVYVSEDGSFAWFDEMLDKPRYGEMRSTGVLRHTEDGWKIVQYHLTFPIPNEIVPDVLELTRTAKRKH